MSANKKTALAAATEIALENFPWLKREEPTDQEQAFIGRVACIIARHYEPLVVEAGRGSTPPTPSGSGGRSSTKGATPPHHWKDEQAAARKALKAAEGEAK